MLNRNWEWMVVIFQCCWNWLFIPLSWDDKACFLMTACSLFSHKSSEVPHQQGLNYSRDTETEQFRGSLKYWQYVIFLCIFVFLQVFCLHPHWSCVKLGYYWSMIHAWAWFITNSRWVRYWKGFCMLPAWFSFSPWKNLYKNNHLNPNNLENKLIHVFL